MALSVLIADANQDFATLIRQSLEESGRYQVLLAASGGETLEMLRSHEVQLAIVDFDLPDIPGPSLIRQMKVRNSQMAIIAIPMESQLGSPSLQNLDVDGVLTKPFYLPDLADIIATSLGLPPESAPEIAAPVRPSLEPSVPSRPATEGALALPFLLRSPERATSFLNRAISQMPVRGAVITRGSLLWASGGDMPQSQIKALARTIGSAWEDNEAGESIARFIRLPGAARDQLVYATHVGGDLLLSVVFDPETPFGQVRQQTERLAELLSHPEPELALAGERSYPAAEPSPGLLPDDSVPAPDEAELSLPRDWIPAGPRQEATMPYIQQGPALVNPAGSEGAAVPTGQPEVALPPLPADWVPDRPRTAEQLPFLFESRPTPIAPASPVVPTPQPAQVVSAPVFDSAEPPAEELAVEEIPLRGIPGTDPSAELTPIAHLPLTVVLIPRFPEHRLEGELAKQLRTWIERLCIAWDWRAETVDIHPQYLALTVRLPGHMAPDRALMHLRRGLSSRILANLPWMAADLPSGRFWAPGQLLAAAEAIEPARIGDFIEQTRRIQGLAN
jgi:CheY-like chemotaxis protein